MPNFSAHLGIAKDAASRLKHPTVDRYLGAFLLGSVSPDIRIMTRGKRCDTHFAHLDFQKKGEGLECLFQLHPHLAQAAGLTEPTRAFIVGYASHLFADELWILELYRPFFGNRDAFQDRLRGDLMDRALQLELDRKEQLALGGLETLRPLLMEAEDNVEVGFISSSTMCEWRQWMEGELIRSFNWDRLRFMARRIISRNKDQPEAKLKEMVEEFLESVPRSLESIYQVIPKERVKAFRERSIKDVLKFAREYLK
ncbi:MAG: zinc dependent phospholipase C family protein [Chloroflexota bacterium]